MRTDPIQDKCFYIIGWVLLALVAGVLAIVHFGVLDKVGGLPPCVLHRVTGLYCPGCGGTRAVIALFHGQILRSLFYHPIVVYTVVIGGWFMLSQTIERLSFGRIRIGMHYRDLYLWLALAIIVINCLVKNLVLIIGGVAPMA